METVVAVSHDRNHHHRCGDDWAKFGSAPSGSFLGINCRSFQSGAGLLPTPIKSYSPSTPVTNKAYSATPVTPSLSANETRETSKRKGKTSTMPIPIKSFNFETNDREFYFSERWAGPTYSNSPPPSSLPIPKFPLRPKRTVSLELPSSATEIYLQPTAKSAPTSPTRGRSPSPDDLFSHADSATKTLRRILNLDITDE